MVVPAAVVGRTADRVSHPAEALKRYRPPSRLSNWQSAHEVFPKTGASGFALPACWAENDDLPLGISGGTPPPEFDHSKSRPLHATRVDRVTRSCFVAVAARTDLAFQQCIDPACRATFSVDEVLTACPSCGNLLDVEYDWDRLRPPTSFEIFERKWMRRSDPLALSGVWRFHELLPYAPRESVVTIGEGQTLLSPSDGVGGYVGMNPGRLLLQYEGLNPSGSFKDNGMSAAFTHARMIGARRAACASTGNTSASLAVYCAVTRLMRGIIFIGSGKSPTANSRRPSITAPSRSRSPATSTTRWLASRKCRASSASISSTA